jgi:hypothetical protein
VAQALSIHSESPDLRDAGWKAGMAS